MRLIYAIPLLLLAAFLHPYLPGRDFSWCAIKIGTGIDCPGCGVVRSVSALLHGDLKESLRFHPLGFAVAGWMAFVWVRGIIWLSSRRKSGSSKLYQGLDSPATLPAGKRLLPRE